MKATREELIDFLNWYRKPGLRPFIDADVVVCDYLKSINSEPDERRAIGSNEQTKEDLCPEGGNHEWQHGIGTRYCRKCGKGFFGNGSPRA